MAGRMATCLLLSTALALPSQLVGQVAADPTPSPAGGLSSARLGFFEGCEAEATACFEDASCNECNDRGGAFIREGGCGALFPTLPECFEQVTEECCEPARIELCCIFGP